ncbi:MAG: response regulator [Chloroflexales bacterium]|jgi:two-component system, chemotaxis family, response regulator Rcp1
MPLVFHPSIKILLVEDSLSDVLIMQDALAEIRVRGSIHVVDDGVKALAFLRNQPPYANALRPDLILLDWNLPRKNGYEVLTEIKSDPILQTIPVVVLTTSQAAEDVAKAYKLHANCYVVKPLEFGTFVHAIQSIQHFWLDVVTLPLE